MLGMSTAKKGIAGKHSGARRARLAKVRQMRVLMIFEQLKAEYRTQPYSNRTIDAIEKEYSRKPAPGSDPDKEIDDQDSEREEQEENGGQDSPISDCDSAGRLRWTDELGVVWRRSRIPSKQLLNLILEMCVDDFVGDHPSVKSPSRETIIKDLKVLGIRNKYRKRSG
jgi:hypothetical protein